MAFAQDPLPSWNDGPAKKAIVDFVEKVTKEGSPDFVPAAERIATFDNDGTLWAEQPMYFQFLFALDRVKVLAPQHPEWKTKEPFASLLKGDLKGALAGGERAMLEIVMATHAGMTTAEFETIVRTGSPPPSTPKTGRLYTEMVYQPMLELLAYLRANGFKTFIVSGGGIEFMRPWTEKVYGIPPEQVIGSSIKTQVRAARRQARAGAPAGSQLHRRQGGQAGRHQAAHRPPPDRSPSATPTATCRCCNGPPRAAARASWALVHHTDAAREWAYDRTSSIGRLDKALDEAQAKGWTVVDMKSDWKRDLCVRVRRTGEKSEIRSTKSETNSNVQKTGNFETV